MKGIITGILGCVAVLGTSIIVYGLISNEQTSVNSAAESFTGTTSNQSNLSEEDDAVESTPAAGNNQSIEHTLYINAKTVETDSSGGIVARGTQLNLSSHIGLPTQNNANVDVFVNNCDISRGVYKLKATYTSEFGGYSCKSADGVEILTYYGRIVGSQDTPSRQAAEVRLSGEGGLQTIIFDTSNCNIKPKTDYWISVMHEGSKSIYTCVSAVLPEF